MNDEINEETVENDLSELDTIPMEFVDQRLEDIQYVRKLVEAVLLVASEPIDIERVAKSLGIRKSVINEAVNAVIADYSERGMVVRKVAGGLELVTNPDVGGHIERFFQMERRRRVSRAALQTLSIIAYNQPVTRAEIEAYRGGINSDGVLQSLLERGLIKIAGKKETPGNPYLYSVSDEFLRYFGLNDIEELKQRLPTLSKEITEDGGITQLRLHDLGMKSTSESPVEIKAAGLNPDIDEIMQSESEQIETSEKIQTDQS